MRRSGSLKEWQKRADVAKAGVHEKVSEEKNGYVKLARKQFPRQTRVPVVHSASHVKHRDDKYEKSLRNGGMPDQMFPLERGTNQGFK